MAKKKAPETVILIRLPDAESKDGTGTLTIQRGDLGHLMEFAYRGLTLRGNIAEAVQNALIALVQLEASPPPHLTTPDEVITETLDESEVDAEITVEAPPLDEVDDDSDLTTETDSEVIIEAPSQDEVIITTETPPPANKNKVKLSPAPIAPAEINTTAAPAQLSLI